MAQPFHLKLDQGFYFITSRTVDGLRFFKSDKSKILLRDTLFAALHQFYCTLFSWVILDNHYHILIQIRNGSEVPSLIKAINGRSSRRLKKILLTEGAGPLHTEGVGSSNISHTEGRLISLPSKAGVGRWRVWNNYWDHCIRDQEDFNNHVRYIEYNPVKHSYVDEAKEYIFVQIYPLDNDTEI